MMSMRKGGKMIRVMPIVGMTFMISRIVTSIIEVVYLVRIVRKLDA
jgi:hypothetical protein